MSDFGKRFWWAVSVGDLVSGGFSGLRFWGRL